MSNNKYFQYIRKCSTKTQEFDSPQIIGKIRKKFNLDQNEASQILTDLQLKNLIFIENEKVKVNILANPVRKNIYTLVSKFPGIFVNEIGRILSIGSNHVRYHLSELTTLKMIKVHSFGNLKAFSLPNISEEETKIGIFLLRGTIKKIMTFLINNSESTENFMLEKIDIPRSTAIYALKKLIDEKWIRKSKKKNQNCYIINPKYQITIQNTIIQLQTMSF